MVARHGAARLQLGLVDYYPLIQREPRPVRLFITYDAVANVPAQRATYTSHGTDEVNVSSVAWYRRGGEQVFLNCPED